MRENSQKERQTGFASIEMVLVTPFLLLLMGGVFELSHYLQANSIVVGIGREGANLVARTSVNTPDEIMTLIAKTSGDIDLEDDGAMFITLVTGQKDKDPYINEQYKWSKSGLTQKSGTWSHCGGWSNHECSLPSPRPTIKDFPLTLDPNESVYVVEVYYQYSPQTGFIYDMDLLISDTTYL
jgi:hypothetical protein